MEEKRRESVRLNPQIVLNVVSFTAIACSAPLLGGDDLSEPSEHCTDNSAFRNPPFCQTAKSEPRAQFASFDDYITKPSC